jgi:hypothetical protein
MEAREAAALACNRVGGKPRMEQREGGWRRDDVCWTKEEGKLTFFLQKISGESEISQLRQRFKSGRKLTCQVVSCKVGTRFALTRQ